MTEQVVVTFTSFPGAIDYAPGVVRSLLAGSVLPDKIVLYVTMSQFYGKELPAELLALQKENEIFEIRDYPADIRSYRKLIPALKDFPEAVIVTVDDDVWYHHDMLKQLLEMHSRFPGEVIAHRARIVKPGEPYKKWKKLRWYHFLARRIYRSPLVMQTGVGGVLYPPHSLKEEMIDEKLFTQLAPTADDIWFWAAAVANGRVTIPVPFGKNKPKCLGKPKSLSLKTVNFKTGEDRNSEALRRILEAFPDVRDVLK